jgi:hypothetical protein
MKVKRNAVERKKEKETALYTKTGHESFIGRSL